MRKKDPKIIRRGDMVKIIKPEFFVRCGYPMDFKDAYEYVDRNHNDAIHRLINEIGDYKTGLSGKEFWFPTGVYRKVVRAFAYDYMKARKFGGNERKIYTKPVPAAGGKVFRVLGVRSVRTGIYTPGSPTRGYDAVDDDFQPPFLREEKAHKILELNYHTMVEDFVSIEAANVEKVF